MSDVEVVNRAEIVRREVDRESAERALAVMDPTVLDTIFSSRDSGKIVQRIADVSRVLMEAVDQQNLSMTFRQNDRPFLLIEAWEFLAAMLGMTVVGVESKPLPNDAGWEATAELRHVASGRVLGSRDGMVEVREYQGRKGGVPAANTLRQMAQIRAARNTVKSVLAFVPRIGGFEISDPEGPVTKEQLAVLHILEREIGWTHEKAHADAGVTSFTKLTREQAGDVIDRWTAIRDELRGGGADTPTPPQTGDAAPRPETSDAVSDSLSGVGDEESPEARVDNARGMGKANGGSKGAAGDSSPSSQAPATAEAWERAPKDMTLSGAVKLAGKLRQENRITGNVPRRKSDFTGEALAKVAAAWRDGERG